MQDAFALELGGIKQWVSIRGEYPGAPVLLVLHGGPGSTMTGMSHTYQRPWEKHWIVVNWDQRCSGRTASVSGSKSPVEITLDRMLQDALELTDYLRERFGRKKIVLLGHSWGTMMGAHLVQKWPDRYAAYISTGTMVNTRKEGELQAKYYRDKFLAEGNLKKLKRLEKLGDFWNDPVIEESKVLGMNRFLIEEGNSSTKVKGLLDEVRLQILPMLRSPEYRLRDTLNFLGFRAYKSIIEHDMGEFDLKALGLEYQMPVYYVEGEQDMQTPYGPAREFYEKTVAPDKAFYSLKNCAHCWDVDAPDQMAQVMCEEIPPRLKQFV